MSIPCSDRSPGLLAIVGKPLALRDSTNAIYASFPVDLQALSDAATETATFSLAQIIRSAQSGITFDKAPGGVGDP